MTESRASVLMVDDRPENLLALEAVLEPLELDLVRASSGEQALKRLLTQDFAVILLDVQMPGIDGFETAAAIKQRERTRHIPIIFLTAISKEAHHVYRGYSAGAVDYVFKPFDAEVLRSKVAVFVDLWQMTRALATSEEQFRRSFDDAPIGMALVAPDGRWLEVNRALCELTGHPEKELLALTFQEITHPDDLEADLDLVRQVLAGEMRGYQLEKRYIRADGSFVPTVLNVSLVRDADGDPLYFIAQIQDMTASKAAEKERAKLVREQAAREQAEASTEMVAKLQTVTDTAIAHLSVERLLHELLDRIHDIVSVDTACILLSDGDDEALTLRAASGLEAADGGVGAPLGIGLDGEVAQTRRTVILDPLDEADGSTAVLRRQGVRALVGIPLLSASGFLGVLRVGVTVSGGFTQGDVSLLQLAAERVGVAIENARVFEHERGIAQTLQRSLLPSRLPRVPRVRLAARYLAGSAGIDVGGDWYDVIELPDGRVGLGLGDVVGRGVNAASVMGQLRIALRAYALEGHSPAGVADRLDMLVDRLGVGEMTTLTYLVFDPATLVAKFTSAGHPPPLLITAEGEATYIEGGRSLPLGVMRDSAYSEAETTIPHGATVLLYTDGLIERRGASIEQGLESLRRDAGAAADGIEALCDSLVAATSGDDDVAVLALRHTPLSAGRLELHLPSDPSALVEMRDSLRTWLAEAKATEADIWEILTACGEACTNAIEHPRDNRGEGFDFEGREEDGVVTISVRDYGSWRPARRNDRGRGLDMMETLMDGVDVKRGPDGTVVTMHRRLRRPVPA